MDAADAIEEMGTKEKFWFRNEDGKRYLFKASRPNTGEDWAEKIAAELSERLKLPHADYEFASFQRKKGTISPSFVPEEAQLTPGNEALTHQAHDYPKDIPKPEQHTLQKIFELLDDSSICLPLWGSFPFGIQSASHVFVGYLLLDAWIGNTDRHHENWALIITSESLVYLAPTYDHASSLGRNEPDHRRQQRLTTPDPGFTVQAYAEKCKSCLYAINESGNPQRLKTFDAFCTAARIYPQAANIWLEHLSRFSSSDTTVLMQRIPTSRISAPAIQFASEILNHNQARLLNFWPEIR